jgi:hypothetical protein
LQESCPPFRTVKVVISVWPWCWFFISRCSERSQQMPCDRYF